VKICVIGSGYVGLVVGACLAETGNDVCCADIDARKIDALKKNVIPIFEPGLDSLVERNQREDRLSFTTDIAKAIAGSEVIFIAVGTPPGEDGSADVQHVLEVARLIGTHATRSVVVVTKSTVPVGTSAKVAAVMKKHATHPYFVCSNPEFLKEGAAVEDFLKPDRVVLGVEGDSDDAEAWKTMKELYSPFVRNGQPILRMDIPSAEMTKYAANAMLATRISFMNEMAHLCEKVGANVNSVRRGIGSDSRIGSAFLFPGPGYGGSCFPKDVKALLRTADGLGVPLDVLRGVQGANERQKHVLIGKLRDAFDGQLSGRHIALWGLAFKPRTDDMREAPSLTLIEDLLDEGAIICAHDPAAMNQARAILGNRIEYAETNYDALEGADALVIVTDWHEYRHPDFERIKHTLKQPLIVDGRNLYNLKKMKDVGLRYYSIGRPTV
jgi:UDPglucose 6-dehydrogenase